MIAKAATTYSTHSAHRRVPRFHARRWSRLKWLALMALSLAAATDARAEEAISLALPRRCQPGVNCFFQNYVDNDTSDKVRDYRCGGPTPRGPQRTHTPH